MFIIKDLQNIEEILKKLRTSSKTIEINFQNECKDSPIRSVLITKFYEKYVVELMLNENVDLSALGKQNILGNFERYPGICYLSYSDQKKFQTAVRIKNGNIQDLNKIFEVAESLDKIDPKFISFIKKLINIEAQYRTDSAISDRFNDLIPDRSLEERRKKEYEYKHHYNFYRPRGRIVQDAYTVSLLDAIEGYARPGGARDIYESDCINLEDIFKANPRRGFR